MLDFDGTLSPIVKHPDLATLPPETRTRLVELRAAPGVSLAIISGRSVADLRQRVAVENITYVGNHGRELRKPGASEPEQTCNPKANGRSSRPSHEGASGVPGVYIENKGFTVALHYRQVPESLRPQVRSCAQEIAQQMADVIEVSEGKCVYDLFPSDGTNKGRLLWLCWRSTVDCPKYCRSIVATTRPTKRFSGLCRPAQSRHTSATYRPLRRPATGSLTPGEVASLLKRVSLLRRSAAKPPPS